jgi:hypothetical protein
MAEEHPKATLIWRKTTWKRETLYTLIGWKNVLSKGDLPAEYTDRGPHFWEAGDTIYISDNKPKSYYANKADRWTVPELYPGQSLREHDFEHLIHHLRRACEWLRRVKRKVSESEEIVVELDPLPDPEPCVPSVASDDGTVVTKKPTLSERVARMLIPKGV